MAGRLPGLTGLYGPVDNVPHGLQGRPASEWGGPADPRHATPGDASHELPYAGTGYGQDGIPYDPTPTDIVDTGFAPAGIVYDHTPTSHAAPYPRGIETDPVAAAEAMQALHGVELGGTRHHLTEPHGAPYPFTVDAAFHDSPNASALAAGVPAQLRQGDDIDQGYGWDNRFGFGMGHQFRRWFRDNIPLDRTATSGGERPFYGAHPVWQNRLDGPDSPYAQAGDTSVGMSLRDTTYGFATPYTPPPNPTVAPQGTYDAQAPVTDDWMAG